MNALSTYLRIATLPNTPTSLRYPPQTIVGFRKDGRPIRVIAGGDSSAAPSAKPAPSAATGPGGLPLPAVPSGGGPTSGSLYGLGGWKDQNINISGFPLPVVAALANAGMDTTKPQTAETVAAALSKVSDAQTVAQLQQMLFYGGFYSNGVKLSDLQLGSFSTADEDALKNLIIAGGQTGQALGTYLTVSAATGYAQGVYLNRLGGAAAGASSGMVYNPVTGTYTPASETFITKPSQADEDYAITQAAQKLLGHLPSEDDIAGFRAYWDQAYVQGQKAAIKAQLAQQQADASVALPSASDLGGALQRQGYLATVNGYPFVPGNGAPAQTILSQGESATAAEHDMRTAQAGLGSVGYTPAAMDVGGQYQNSSTVTNPAYSAYEQQRNADMGVINQVNAAGDAMYAQANNQVSVQDPGAIDHAAEDFLQQHDAAGVGAQNVVSKYSKLLQILGGTG